MARLSAWGEEFALIGGRPVYGPQDERIGDVEVIYYDDTSGKAQWIGVRDDESSRGLMLLPLATVRLQDSSLHIPYSKQQVMSAPAIGGADRIPPETEQQLYTHYQFQPEEHTSGSPLQFRGRPSDEANPRDVQSVRAKSEAYKEKAQMEVPDYPEYASQDPHRDRHNDGVDGSDRTDGTEIRRVGARKAVSQERTLGEELQRGQSEARDIGREVADIASDLQKLIQQEIQLAKTEMAEQMRLSTRAITWGAIAGVMGFFMLAFVCVTVMFALAEALPLWVSALITTGILAVLAAVAGIIAYQRFKQVSFMPQRTMESVKEDVEWARSQLK
jgi:uncharacterized membrane protein YqjE